MASLAELTVQVLTARLAKRDMSLEELKKEVAEISEVIRAVDEGTLTIAPAAPAAEEAKPEPIDMKKVFGKDKVICLICKKEFSSLTRHLDKSHNMKPKEYRAQFGIDAKQKLCSKTLSANAKKSAIEKDLAGKMAAKKAQKEVTDIATEDNQS